MKISKDDAFHKSKHGIALRVYKTGTDHAGLVYVEVEEGHFQEFYDKKSTFIYYIIDGEGTFYLNGEPTGVEAGDVLAIPPKTKIYYLGKMRMVLVTAPSWKEENEVHVRYIEKPK